MEYGFEMSGLIVRQEDMELLEAVRRGDLQLTNFLLEGGVDINVSVSHDGWTSLHWACKLANLSMVAFLLSRGADKLIKTKAGQLPRDLTNSVEILTLLQRDSPSTKGAYHVFPDRLSNDLPHNMLNRSDLIVRYPAQDILIKIRIANSNDPDFIEVELQIAGSTYQNLLAICCQELEILPDQVDRIRKLPDTRIRCDADVQRLKPLQELEIVLKESQLSSSNSASANIYPSISANKNQTVLY